MKLEGMARGGPDMKKFKMYFDTLTDMSRCSSVSIVTDYELNDQGSIPGRDKEFFF
jgi:hypothetical protein